MAKQPRESMIGEQPMEIETGGVDLMENGKSLESMEHETGLIESETGLQQMVCETVITPVERETGMQLTECNIEIQQLEGETIVQALGSETGTQTLESQITMQPMSDPSHYAGGMGLDSTSELSVPTEVARDTEGNPDSTGDGQEVVKMDKRVAGQRTYPPKRNKLDPLKVNMSKPAGMPLTSSQLEKDRLDPLKIDMSNHVVMPLTSSQLSLQCIECHIIFSDAKSKERHLKLNHREKYPPTMETETTMQPMSDLSHNNGGMGLDSTSQPSVPTEGNRDSTGDRQEVVKMDKGAAGERKYIPPKKDRLDPLKIDMSNPGVMPLTSSQLSLQCIECHIIFSDSKSKERHLKLSHPAEYEQCILRNALFACYICDRHFTNSTDLMTHQKAHTERQPFKCPICCQAFNRSSELTLHKKIHFGLDGYACSDCGKPCKTLTLLKYHRRTHTGERPYVCRECGKRFSMSKALQKHMESHSPEGAEGGGGTNTDPAKAQQKKNNGTSTIKYPCPICKATFKTTKTRLHHMKNKHNLCPAATSNTLPAGQQVKQSVPIITPTSICQPTLMHMEPIGPLQQVDANIDTEQIRKLIESLGNVQKVNQLVILGQVPPHALPLNLQQIQGLGEPIPLNLIPQQVEMVELKRTGESKTVENPCDSLEQSIILEPITPDGQLENHSFSHTQPGAHTAPPEHLGLTLVVPEQTQSHEGDMIPDQLLHQPQIGPIQSYSVDQMVYQNEVADLKQDSEQTVILELTSALIPTVELEQTQSVPHTERPTSSLVPTIELEKTSDQTVIGQQETDLAVPSLIPTVQLEVTPLQTDQPDLPSCHFVPSDTFTQTLPGQSQANQEGEADSQMQTMGMDQVRSVMERASVEETNKIVENELSEKSLVESKEKSCRGEDPTVKEQVVSQLETKKAQQISNVPISVMSAQELVKVRKRKPARKFSVQGNMQQLTWIMQEGESHIGEKLAKRKRTKKSRLVVKFCPKNKDKKNKKPKKPSQSCQVTREELIKDKTSITNLLAKKGPKKKGRKAKKDKGGHSVSTMGMKSTSSMHDSQVQQSEEEPRKKKMKRQNKGIELTREQDTMASSGLKKKKQQKIIQKCQPKKTKVGKLTSKGRKTKLTMELKKNAETNVASANMPSQQITQDSLLLLKGHKQPQLKVYKLDTSKSPGQTQDTSLDQSQTASQQSKDITLKRKKKDPNGEPPTSTTVGEKKVGKPKKSQKALSMLSPLRIPPQTPETLPTKPKTTRKRKASSKVETEGVISSPHSRRALECKDCGERFSEVSSLQEHKATMHIVESPGLTYTNGNVFEGVSRLDLCQPPKMTDGVMNAATDWDTEAEMGEMALEEREGRVSFPALNPSPSFPLAAPAVEGDGYEQRSGNTSVADITSFIDTAKEPPELSTLCHSPPQVLSQCDSKSVQIKTVLSDSQSPPCSTYTTPCNISHQIKGPETVGSLASEEDKSECQASGEEMSNNPLVPNSESEVQCTTDEEVKEDVLLDVDLVTVGEQSERDDPTLTHDSGSQTVLSGSSNHEIGSIDTLVPNGQIENQSPSEIGLTSQSASCSTHQPEIKEEEEEDILVQRKEEGTRAMRRRGVTRGRRGKGRLKRGAKSRQSLDEDDMRGTEPENGSDECQVVYQQHSLTVNSEIKDEGETSATHHSQSTSLSSQPENGCRLDPNKTIAPATSVTSMPSLLEESPDEQVVFELESVTTSVEEVMKSEEGLGLEGVEEKGRETGQSPGIILERFLTSRQREASDEEHCLMSTTNNQGQESDSTSENEVVFLKALGSQEIKVEENTSEMSSVVHTFQSRQRVEIQPQQQRGVRSVLVKQESSLILSDPRATQGSRRIRWNVEERDIENTSDQHTQSEGRTRASSVDPELSTRQCIFYPVKEEEREVLLGASQSNNSTLTLGVSTNARLGHQTEHLPASDVLLDEGSPAIEEYEETRLTGGEMGTEANDFEITGEGEAGIEQQDTPELRDFLLQISDEEDSNVFEFSDPQPYLEAEAMAYYHKSQRSGPPQRTEMSNNLLTSESQAFSSVQRGGEENGSRGPIEYFSKYFGWDTWLEIAQCTNKLSKLPNPVTAKEVAQFVGIHIAMGTLKFPSLKLYWQDFTKVPLIAEAMSVSRFLQLSRKLKLAYPAEDPTNNVREERHDRDIQNVDQATARTGSTSSCDDSSSHGQIPLLSCEQSNGDKTNDLNFFNIQTDPLWRVQPLLDRFNAGCLLLRREGDYGVDQYPLPLTAGKVNNNKPSLQSTTLVGADGLIVHLDLNLDLSNKETAVEKMVPRDSMVFLCKQELSTPAMLERLLAAGVHGAGRVGGARGQIGDEFVSSDGRLMLRRSHRGFVLATVGNGQRNMSSVINNFEKAQALARLNRDLQNIYRIPLTASAPTCWPQAVLWYLTDLALVNSWHLYRQDHGPEPQTLMAFRLEVSKALILSSDTNTQDSIRPQPPTQKAHTPEATPNPRPLQESPLPDATMRYDGSGHWPEQLGEGEGGRCRFGGCERTSRVLCLKCCVFLCISRNHNCFLNFHNQGSM